jgi:hypothetical protein
VSINAFRASALTSRNSASGLRVNRERAARGWLYTTRLPFALARSVAESRNQNWLARLLIRCGGYTMAKLIYFMPTVQHHPVPRQQTPGLSGLRMFGHPIVVAIGQPDGGNPAYVCQRQIYVIRPEVIPTGKRTGPGDNGTATRRPSFRAATGSGTVRFRGTAT